MAAMSNTESLQRLIERPGINLNIQNERGETPLYKAYMAGSSENAEALLQWGADPSVPEKSANVTCLHWIFCFPSDHIVVLARLLVQHGTDINALAVRATPSFHYPFWFSARTPFHWAVLVGCYSVMQSLYNLGADASILDTSDPYRYLLDVRLEQNSAVRIIQHTAFLVSRRWY
jgi:ankyrin repeat protein